MTNQEDLRQNYTLMPVPYDPKKGYPVDRDLYYECPLCKGLMTSFPPTYDEATCGCDFLSIDIDAGRFSVRDHANEPALFRLIPKSLSG